MAAGIKYALATFCASLALCTSAVQAADVTYERLLNPEPQNWLTNHHDFGAHRFSALDIINKSNVKNLKLAFAIAIGGTSGNENLEATPLVDDGFMYMTDAWGVVYKIDVRSGTSGRVIWNMDPLSTYARVEKVFIDGDLFFDSSAPGFGTTRFNGVMHDAGSDGGEDEGDGQ